MWFSQYCLKNCLVLNWSFERDFLSQSTRYFVTDLLWSLPLILYSLIVKLVDARGVEPLSLKSSTQTYYKLVRFRLPALALKPTNHLAGCWKVGLSWASQRTQFFARYRRPSSLTSIQSRTGSLRSYSSFFSPAKLSENRVSFGQRRSHINIIIGSWIT